ncbi:hypothetical protein [Reticulibacter mediterranei]|uniref:hypothetical protein n=1 Tax=Reticulibacter mediterranei TaxID=2778369 RepID=UPI001C68B28F|nr:hypothetical protein [Reticulibacter mediterranei]
MLGSPVATRGGKGSWGPCACRCWVWETDKRCGEGDKRKAPTTPPRRPLSLRVGRTVSLPGTFAGCTNYRAMASFSQMSQRDQSLGYER